MFIKCEKLKENFQKEHRKRSKPLPKTHIFILQDTIRRRRGRQSTIKTDCYRWRSSSWIIRAPFSSFKSSWSKAPWRTWKRTKSRRSQLLGSDRWVFWIRRSVTRIKPCDPRQSVRGKLAADRYVSFDLRGCLCAPNRLETSIIMHCCKCLYRKIRIVLLSQLCDLFGKYSLFQKWVFHYNSFFT